MSGNDSRDAAQRVLTPTRVIIVSFILLFLGVAGYRIEASNAVPAPDKIGFGVTWDHGLHAGLADYNCQSCHHTSAKGQTTMAACDNEACHLRSPARNRGQEGLLRLNISFSSSVSVQGQTPQQDTGEQCKRYSREAAETVLKAESRFRTILNERGLVDNSEDETKVRCSWKLTVDVVGQDNAVNEAQQWIEDALGSAVPGIDREKIIVTPVPDQRLALHRNCIGCHNAGRQYVESDVPDCAAECARCSAECAGCRSEECQSNCPSACADCRAECAEHNTKCETCPVACSDCHTNNRGSQACGSCHPTELAKIRGGSHRHVACAACHSRSAEELVGEASHAHPVPSAASRQSCLSCHGESGGADPTGMPRRQLDDDQLPADRAQADQAHSPSREQARRRPLGSGRPDSLRVMPQR